MHSIQRYWNYRSEDAVSPVVGVMLMLVVVIIIAAVVSGFAGNLVGGTNQKSPSLTMDVRIANSGTWVSSGFTATVTSVSEPIPTKNLKIVTSWKTTNRESGASISGGNTSTPYVNNVMIPVVGGGSLMASTAPYGSGPGVNSSAGSQDPVNPFTRVDQQFGNYSLVQGTGLTALPYGSNSAKAIGAVTDLSDDGGYGIPVTKNAMTKGPFKYTFGSSFVDGSVDATQAVLGFGWQNLRVGDVVNVQVVHIPTGKVIFDKDVVVTEG